MIAVKDLRQDPGETDNFALEAAAFEHSKHSLYKFSGGREGKVEWHRGRTEVGLKIDVSDEEYSYEEVSYDDENDENKE